MENKVNYIYETHDTPFGAYTLRFRDINGQAFNDRVMAVLKEIDERGDLSDYNLEASTNKKGPVTNTFKVLPKDETGVSIDEIVDLYEEEEEEKTFVYHHSTIFTNILDNLNDNPMLTGYFYNSDKKVGSMIFNGTDIKMTYMDGFWILDWTDGNHYSLGCLKEILDEFLKKEFPKLKLDWRFFYEKDGKIEECYVGFVE